MPGPCSVGFADDFLLADGSLSFPDYDLGRLRTDDRLALKRVPSGAVHLAHDLAAIDVLVSVPMTTAIGVESLDPAGRLMGIVRVGVGCDDVDLDACTAAGVAVVTPTDAVRRPTAIAALTLLLALATRLVDKDRLTREGAAAWARRPALRGHNLAGRTLGLLGCGSIGSDLAALVRPLGLTVIAHDPALEITIAAAAGIRPVDMATLFRQSDYLSIHCPLTTATRGLVGRQALAAMKRGAMLINTARGGIVDQAALVEALVSGRIAAAGLDVFEPEPLPPDSPLLLAPNILFSAHALNWTIELDADLARQNIAAVYDLIEGREPWRVVNPGVLAAPRFRERREALRRRLAGLSRLTAQA